ncbi:tetratricopeptide repeat-containing sulfotransferase family protein [Roseimaritima ulvae]|uniref:Tetratricopeptide repeat protein n=2 Tax=Roseimaritima ulvae TaxID=980254 RepID=A0A5B9QNA7_9BACT|nr:tetratricopeptide repeat-containing sulfotransferase family protein [Roseimaritima ulvae]QEG39372.1 Tetratricopeptide repeat protein [Roseimaritima ulvae]
MCSYTITDYLEAHRRGDVAFAELGYRKLLLASNQNYDVLHLLAMLCLETERPDEAFSLIAMALKVKPESAVIWNSAGVIHRQNQQIQEAKNCWLRALDLDGRLEDAYVNLLDTLSAEPERPPEFRAICIGAIENRVPLRRPYYELARLQLEEDDQIGAAETWLRMIQERLACESDVLELADSLSHPEAINQVVKVCHELARREDAPVAALQTLSVILTGRLSPYHQRQLSAEMRSEIEATVRGYLAQARQLSQSGKGLFLIARCLRQMGYAAEAIDHLQTAFRLDPQYLPIQQCLANATLETGDVETARAIFRSVVTGDHPMPQSEFELSRIEEVGSPEAISRLREMLRSVTLPEQEKKLCLFALGNRLQSQEKWEEAATQYLLASEIGNTDEQLRNKERYSAQPICRTYDAEYFQAVQWHDRCESDLPIFIVGMPRSGTTLVEQILSCHPDLFAAGELPTIAHLFDSLTNGEEQWKSDPQLLRSSEIARLKPLGDQYIAELMRRMAGAEMPKRVTDKMPTNHRYLGFIANILPKANIVHVLREPKDVFASCIQLNLNWPFSDPDALVYYIKQYQRLMMHWRKTLPINLVEVQYEQLVQNARPEVSRLLESVGLEWDESCLNHTNARREVRTPSKAQVRRGLYTTSIDKWKRYERVFGKYYARLDQDSE